MMSPTKLIKLILFVLFFSLFDFNNHLSAKPDIKSKVSPSRDLSHDNVKKILETLNKEINYHNFFQKGLADISTTNTAKSYIPETFRDFGIAYEAPEAYDFNTMFQSEGYNFRDYSPQAYDSIQFRLSEAESLLNKVIEENRFVDYLTEGMVFELPVGIRKVIGGVTFSLVVHQMRLSPNKAYLDVYLSADIPQKGADDRNLTFMGKGVEFTMSGGISGVGKVELIGDFDIPFAGNKVLLTLLGGTMESNTTLNKTYATFDCYGFREMGLAAEVRFSPDLIVEEDGNGNKKENEPLTINFNTVINDWNNLIVSVSIPRFQMRKLEGVSFTVNQAVFDFSDNHNPAGIKFPENYESAVPEGLSTNLWRGFYLQEAVVELPNQFNKNESNERTKITAKDLIIDSKGVTGGFFATNLISLNQGTSSKWAMSLDSIGFTLVQSNINSAGFKGKIIIPVIDKNNPLAYEGLIFSGNNYALNVALTDSLKFDIWSANTLLTENSSITLKVQDGEFLPEANLHGSMSIKAKLGNADNSKASLTKIDFRGLKIKTTAPYLQAEAFSLGAEGQQQRLSGFPVTINNIGFETEGEKSGIKFDLVVNFVSGSNGFGGESTLVLWGEQNPEEKWHSWRLKNVEVRRILVNIDKGDAFKLRGQVLFFKDDETYGSGFRGDIQLTVKGDLTLEAMALFGTVDGFRYWYADAMVTFSPTITFVTGLDLAGFGGGIYYHMRQRVGNEPTSNIGKSNSGVVYVPDKDVYLGLKATIKICTTGSEKVFNADATFEINFNSSGGVNQVAFLGNAYFVTPDFNVDPQAIKASAGKAANDEEEDIKTTASFYGKIQMLYDVPTKMMHATIDVHVNLSPVIEGIGANKRAGRVEMHFEPGKWYIHVGKPIEPVGVKVMGSLQATAYFMVGHDMPDPPQPPNLIVEILNLQHIEANRDLAALASGTGLAFGAGLHIDTGDQRFLIFYGRFAATAGLDFMMTNYGEATCAGSSGQIGINGWYAQGQAYVGLMCVVGIDIKLKFINKQVEIFSGAAAALMQAKGPSPMWMKGQVGGTYNVLNGLVKGSFRFEVEFGEQCEIQQQSTGSPLDDMEIIAALTPNDGSQEVDVFTSPQVVFNIPVERTFELIDMDGKTIKYRVKVDHLKLMDGSSEINTAKQWTENKDVVALKLTKVLPSNKELKLDVQLSFEEWKNSTWQKVKENNQEVIERKLVSFLTGEEPDYIPKDNILYSYPIEKQANFYVNEYGKGYVKLNLGQIRPFENPGGVWDFKASFTDDQGNSKRAAFVYRDSENEVEFDIPQGISLNKVIKFELLRVPVSTLQAIDRNVSKVSRVVEFEGVELENSMEINTKSVEGTIADYQEQSILEYYFKTSKYTTLQNKFSSPDYQLNRGWRYPIREGIHELGYTLTGSELFDVYEITGVGNEEPLIQMEADFSGNLWYENYLYPIIYQGYPISRSATITHREASVMGVPPAKAVFQRQFNTEEVLRGDGFNSNITYDGSHTAMIYNIAHYAELDLMQLRSKVGYTYSGSSTSNERIQRLLTSEFPIIRQGPYNVMVRYKLPGKNITTSSFNVTIQNPVGPVE